MNRRLLPLVAAVFLFAGAVVSSYAPTASATGSVQGSTTIAIDGKEAGKIVSWEGGDPRASVVPGPTADDGTATKQPGAPMCAPLVMQSAFPPAGPLRDWLGEFLSNQSRSKEIVLTDFDAMGHATRRTECDGARLVEVRLPAFDATAASPGNATFVFKVQESREVTPAAAAASAAARTSSVGFRLAVDGLDGSGIARIEPISITRTSTDDEFLSSRTSTSTPGAIEFSNLTVTMTRARSETWRAWFTDFVINGNGSNSNEKNGALEFLSPDLKQVVFALRFQNMGILRASRVNAAAAGSPEMDQAELYFERVLTSTAATAAADTGSSSQTETAGPQQDTSGAGEGENTDTGASAAESETTQPLEAIPVQTDSIGSMEMGTGMLSDATTSTTGTPTLNVGDRLTSTDVAVADSTTPPTRAAAVVGTTATVTTTTSNPADQGSRDPAGFPRVEGLTRLDFSGQYHTTSTLEESHYTTPDKIYDLLARVDAAAKAAGWTLVHFAEGYSQGEKWVTEQWKKDNMAVSLEIDQPDTGVTRYWIRVITQKPATN